MTFAFLPSLPPLPSLHTSSYPYRRSKVYRRPVVRCRAIINESGDDGTFGNVDERDTVGLRIPGLRESDLSYAHEAKTAGEYRQRLVEAINRADEERKERQRKDGYASVDDYMETLSKPKVEKMKDEEVGAKREDKTREAEHITSVNRRGEDERRIVRGRESISERGPEEMTNEKHSSLIEDHAEEVEMKREGKASTEDTGEIDRKALNFNSQPLENDQMVKKERKKLDAAAQGGSSRNLKRVQYLEIPKTDHEEQLTDGDLNQFYDEDMQKEILREISAMERQMAELNAVVQKEIEHHEPTGVLEAMETSGTRDAVGGKNNDVKAVSDSLNAMANTKEEKELSVGSHDSEEQVSSNDASQEALDTLNTQIAFLEKRLRAISAQESKKEDHSAKYSEHDLQNAGVAQEKDVLEQPADQRREASSSFGSKEEPVDWSSLFEDTPNSDLSKEEKMAAFKSMYALILEKKEKKKARAEAAAARVSQEMKAMLDDPRQNADSMSRESALEHAVIELRLESNRYLEKARCDLDDHEDRIRRIFKKYLPDMCGS